MPLVDLKAGFYLGEYQGGLYPSGKNFPPAGHVKKGLKIAKTNAATIAAANGHGRMECHRQAGYAAGRRTPHF